MAVLLQLASNRPRPQRHLRPHSFPPYFLRVRPCRPYVCARATYQEAICQEIPLLDWSNLCIRGGQLPPPQPHGGARLFDGILAVIISEGGLSLDNSAAPTSKSHTSLEHRRPGNHLKKYCNQQPHLGRLILTPSARQILQGRHQHRPVPLQSQGHPIINCTAALQLRNGVQRLACSSRLFQPPVHNPE